MRDKYPILEHDPTPRAVIEPSEVVKRHDVPEHCVLCFPGSVITPLVESGSARHIISQRSTMGEHPVYEAELEGRRFALTLPGLCAPFAAAFLEELIARGCRKFIAFGTCGVLDRDIPRGHVVVPTSAIRDEGTSYHYLPPSRDVQPTPGALAAVQMVLAKHDVPYLLGTTWTTDAVYRETPDKVALRKSEGCITVEMEAAALFAVARFRGVELAQILHAGDDVSGQEWDAREKGCPSDLERHFWLAAEACLAML